MVTGCRQARVLKRAAMGASPGAGIGRGGVGPRPCGWGYFGPDRRAYGALGAAGEPGMQHQDDFMTGPAS